MKPFSARTALPLVMFMLTLSGCSVLPKPNQVVTYQLPQLEVELTKPVASTNTGSLRVYAPQATRELASDRIVIVQVDGRLTAWKGIRWNDTVPNLFADRLVEAFLVDGRISNGSVDSHSSNADVELTGNLRAFQVEYGSDGTLFVALRADMRLESRVEGKVIKSRRFVVARPVHGKDEAQVVRTFGEASNLFAHQVVVWALDGDER